MSPMEGISRQLICYVHAGADPIKGTFFSYVEREGTLSTWWCCPGAGHPDILDKVSTSLIYLATALTATIERSRKQNHDPTKIMIIFILYVQFTKTSAK